MAKKNLFVNKLWVHHLINQWFHFIGVNQYMKKLQVYHDLDDIAYEQTTD